MSIPDKVIKEIPEWDTTEYATPDAALEWTLALAWTDLSYARRQALDKGWSVGCQEQLQRIVGLTRLIGPINWKVVPLPLVLDQTYKQVYATYTGN